MRFIHFLIYLRIEAEEYVAINEEMLTCLQFDLAEYFYKN